ncbi:MAG TPA: hypothetical protein EYN66_00460 [Myxococcales bacterium]|nr:hypothetical protein [Myxococcales bacterium]
MSTDLGYISADSTASVSAFDTYTPLDGSESGNGVPLDAHSSEPDAQALEGSSRKTPDSAESPLTLEELVELLMPEAFDLIKAANPWDMPYMKYCSELLARLVIELPPLHANKWDLETLVKIPPVEIVELEIAPNTTIPLHDHRDYIGAILAIDGQVDCVNYTRIDGPAEPGAFLLQQSKQALLTPGDTSCLGLSQHNFHLLKSGAKTARMVDIFTFVPGGEGHSYWAQINDTPVNEEQGIYSARWL